MASSSLYERIEQRRKELGSALTVVGHHYQAEDVIRHADLRGDSLELARRTAAVDSKYIVFCGVYFMAESAALLAGEGQQVHLPDPSAECSMALMSPADRVESAMQLLTRNGRKVVPLAYVNSTLDVKAVVGRYGGAVCTSANAKVMLEWAMKQGDGVLFLPDENLGGNTADQLGISEADRHRIDIRDNCAALDTKAADRAALLLWPGFCSIHTCFTPERVAGIRAAHPGIKVVVHPECTPATVQASDAAGSTSFIIRYVEEALDGETIAIGTEVNLVKRLAEQHKARLTIMPLLESACPHMAQANEERLALCLDALVEDGQGGLGSRYRVSVAEELKAPAKACLERMLAVCN